MSLFFKLIKIEKKRINFGIFDIDQYKINYEIYPFCRKTDIFCDAYREVIANDSNDILVIVHDFLENQRLVQSVQLF